MILAVGDAKALPVADSCVDTVVTSPPYWGMRDYGADGEIGAEPDHEEYISNLIAVLAEVRRVLKPNGNVFMVMGDKYVRTGGIDRKPRDGDGSPGGRRHIRRPQRGVKGIPDGSLLGLPYRLAIAAIADGWLWRQNIVWVKPNPLPESVKRRCTQSHETVIHLTMTAQHYAAPCHKGGRLGPNVCTIPVEGYRDPRGVPTPAVYPRRLVRGILSRWCPLNGLVLDPFLGSGTTAVVAKDGRYRFIGLDLSIPSMGVAARRVAWPDQPVTELEETA